MNAVANYSKLISSSDSRRHNFGAIAHDDGGVTFRVQVTGADHLYLLGEFNNWDEARTPLQNLGEGIWQVMVEDADIGDEYLFVYFKGAERVELVDPNASQLTQDRKMAIIE